MIRGCSSALLGCLMRLLDVTVVLQEQICVEYVHAVSGSDRPVRGVHAVTECAMVAFCRAATSAADQEM